MKQTNANPDGEVEILSQLRKRKRFLTVDEIADLLFISNQTIYRLVRDGRIPHMKVGGASIRFDPKMVADWIERSSSGMPLGSKSARKY